MEMRRYILSIYRRAILSLLLLLLCNFYSVAQAPSCKVKDGNIVIELPKTINDKTFNEFIRKFDLGDLPLWSLVRKDETDSLLQLGWTAKRSRDVYVISKPLFSVNTSPDVADNISLTQKPEFSVRFASTDNGVRIGANKFSNRSFSVWDSSVTFFLRNYPKANKVMLAGSFNNWIPNSIPMQKTDSGWIARVRLGAGKYWYKFITDGNWITDPDNQLKENDGEGNVNSVFYKTNHVFRLEGATNAKKVFVSGSFVNWEEKKFPMTKTSTGWVLPVYLSEGTHTYRFIADGHWFADPVNPDKLPNEFGEFNSFIAMGKPYYFRLAGFTSAKQVLLSGSFNGWRKDELFMKKSDKGWELPYVLGPGNYEYKFLVDGKWVTDPVNQLTAGSGKDVNSFMIINPNYVFRLKGFDKAKTVFLAGDFNSWAPGSLRMKYEAGVWTFPVHLFKGKHLYKFIVDGNWIRDPDNKLWEDRDGNSVLWMDK